MALIAIPDQQQEIQNRLSAWVAQQPGSITVEEAAEFLDMPRDSDGTYYSRQSIEAALENLGCEREVLIHFWPPAARLPKVGQPLHQPQPTDKEELQNIINIINIIRDWVLSQIEPFMLADIYSKPEISQQLECNPVMLHLIHRALLALKCTPIDINGNKVYGHFPHEYIPPQAANRKVTT